MFWAAPKISDDPFVGDVVEATDQRPDRPTGIQRHDDSRLTTAVTYRVYQLFCCALGLCVVAHPFPSSSLLGSSFSSGLAVISRPPLLPLLLPLLLVIERELLRCGFTCWCSTSRYGTAGSDARRRCGAGGGSYEVIKRAAIYKYSTAVIAAKSFFFFSWMTPEMWARRTALSRPKTSVRFFF